MLCDFIHGKSCLTNSTWFLIKKLPCWTGETHLSSPIQSMAVSEISLSELLLEDGVAGNYEQEPAPLGLPAGCGERRLLRARALWVMTIQFMVVIKDPGPWSSCGVQGTCQAHVQGKSCLTEGDITSNLCKTALYYQAFLFLKPWNSQAESQRKGGDIRGTGTDKTENALQRGTAWLSSAPHRAGDHWPRPVWRKNKKHTSAPEDSRPGDIAISGSAASVPEREVLQSL